MGKHTEGPWEQVAERIGDDPVDETYRTIKAGKGFPNEEGGFRLTGFMTVENATLIAAAPDMAEEIKHLRRVNADLLEALEAMLEGELYADGEGICSFARSDMESGEHAVALARAALKKARPEHE